MNTAASTPATDTRATAWGEDYRTKGYVHIRGLFTTDEVAAWQAESDRLLADRSLIHEENWRTPFRKYDDGNWKIEKLDPVADVSPVYHDLFHDPRLLGAVEACFGEEGRLFKDKIIFKPAGQGGFAPHQDWTWWQPFPQDLLSAMVAIDGASEANGALQLYPGLHHSYLLPPGELRSIRPVEEIPDYDDSKWEMVETEPGDVILFHCLAPHRSGRNVSTTSRRQLYLTYSPSRHGDLYDAHYEHYKAYYTKDLEPFFRDRIFFR